MKFYYYLVFITLFSKGLYAQSGTKDSLFFKLDQEFLIPKVHPVDGYLYYVFKNSGNNGLFYLTEMDGTNGPIIIEKEEIINPKSYINKLRLKFKKVRGKGLNDWTLSEHFESFVIFLVKKEEQVQLQQFYVID